MSDTNWKGTASGNWFTATNWNGGVPVVTSTGSEIVLISGTTTNQPTISAFEAGAPGTIYVDQGTFTGTALKEIQIDGQYITLTSGANLHIQDLAIGRFHGTDTLTSPGKTINDLTSAKGISPEYDNDMSISTSGTDTLTFNGLNENFGEINASGTGNTFNLVIGPPAGPGQTTNTLWNYGLIESDTGGVINIGTVSANGTTGVFANPGWIVAEGGTVVVNTAIVDGANVQNGSVKPDGYIEIGSAGTVILNGSVADREEVMFLDNTKNVLDINGAGFNASIANFGTLDSIVLGPSVLPTPNPASAVSFSTIVSNGFETLTVTSSVNGVVKTDSLTFAAPVPGRFVVTSGPNGIIISDIPCFAAGTRILTPNGDVPVQALAVGDEVLTLRDGADAVRKVIWAGRRTIDLTRHPRPEKVMPVRILAGALGTGLPERDLVLSPDHCLYLDGHLIEAKTLVNGATIIQDDRQRSITYHHIELDQHDIVLAEGVAVETYLDSENRQMFDGAAAAVLHPDFAPQSRKKACANLLLDGPVVHAARQRLLDRALALGFAITDESDLTLKAGIEKLSPASGSTARRMTFNLTRGYAEIDLLSSAGVPAHMAANPDDRRRLGVAVTAMRLLTETGPIDIALDDPAHRGFHAAEPTHRWTDGAARIALPAYSGRAVLEIQLRGQAARWVSNGRPTAISA